VLLTILIIARQIFGSGFSMTSVRTKLILTFLLVCVVSIGLVSFFTYLTWYSNAESAGQALQLATLIVLILTTGIAVLLSQLFVAPISRLTAAARQIAAGDLTAKAQVESQDEIGVLANTFNTMLGRSRTQRITGSETTLPKPGGLFSDMIAVLCAKSFLSILLAQEGGAKSPDELIGQPILNRIFQRILGMEQRLRIRKTSALSGWLPKDAPTGRNGQAVEPYYIVYGKISLRVVVRDITSETDR
jgi:HAMP domain-containing protein